MEHRRYSLHQSKLPGHVNTLSVEKWTQLFITALMEDDEKKVMALTYAGRPIISMKWGYNKESFLHFYCRLYHSKIAIIQFLIDCGIDVNEQNMDGDTALHIAARCNEEKHFAHIKLVKLLLKNKATKDIRNRMGLTPIQVSLLSRNLEITECLVEDKLPNVTEVDRLKRCRRLMEYFIREHSDLNVPSTRFSILLQFLIPETDEETFEYVVKNTEFDANAVNYEGHTLLQLVVTHGTSGMLKALISAGADPDAATVNNGTPLVLAIKNTRTQIFHCLLDCGASVNQIERNFPLHYAVCMQSFEMVEALVKKGADVNALSFHRSPLLLACGSIYSKKWFTMFDELQSLFHTDSGFLFSSIDDILLSPQIVEVLLDHGADIEAKNASNRTALDQACKLGKLEIVKLLLRRGAKINQGDVTTLHHAVRGQNAAIVKLILERGADVNYRCAPEKTLYVPSNHVSLAPRTPLDCAIIFIGQDSRCKDIIEILMEYGLDVNVADPVRKETPLHLAFLSDEETFFSINRSTSKAATVKLLLEHSASVNALDSKELTPLKYALRNYSFTRSGRATLNYSSHFKPDLVNLIAFITKMIENKERVMEENLVLLEDESARPIYQECSNELSLMKKDICESRNFSFFDILCKDIQSLGGALKNKDILQVLNGGEYKQNFPIYAEYLEERIREATIRQSLVDLGIVLFKKHVNKKISVEPLLHILRCLNLPDLKNFSKACFVSDTGCP